MTALWFEDMEVGQQFAGGPVAITEEESIRFAKDFDPQPFHVEHEAGNQSSFGRLVTSGWHTAALTMRMKTQTDLASVSGGLIGLGLDQVRWPKPVYPGDTLRAVFTIIEKRRSQKKPTHGIVRYKAETFNQADELVMEMETAVWVPCREN